MNQLVQVANASKGIAAKDLRPATRHMRRRARKKAEPRTQQHEASADGGGEEAASYSSSPSNYRSDEIQQHQLAALHYHLARQAAADAADWERQCLIIQRTPSMAENLQHAQSAALEARQTASRESEIALRCDRAARKFAAQADEEEFLAQMRVEAATAAKRMEEEAAKAAEVSEAKLKAREHAKIEARAKQRERWAKAEAERAKARGGAKAMDAAKAAEPKEAADVMSVVAAVDHESVRQEQPSPRSESPAAPPRLTAMTRPKGDNNLALERMLVDARRGALKFGQRLGLRLNDSKHGGFAVEPMAMFTPLVAAWRRMSKDENDEQVERSASGVE